MMMITNQIFRKTAMALALTAAVSHTAMAEETSVGQATSDFFISGDFNRNLWDPDDARSSRNNGYRARASASYQSAGALGMQFDGVYTDKNLGSMEFSTTDLAAHFYVRNENFLFGVFGQYRQPNLTKNFRSTGEPSEDASIDLSTDQIAKVATPQQSFFGVEGQGYFGDLTVSGQAGMQIFQNQARIYGQSPKLLDDGYVGTLSGTYFLHENWKVDLQVSHNRIRTNGSFGDIGGLGGLGNDDLKQTFYGFSSEARLPETPVSVFFSAGRTKLDAGSFDMTNDQLSLGLKLSFGGADTLKAQNRRGASLNPVSLDPLGSVLVGTVFNEINRTGAFLD